MIDGFRIGTARGGKRIGHGGKPRGLRLRVDDGTRGNIADRAAADPIARANVVGSNGRLRTVNTVAEYHPGHTALVVANHEVSRVRTRTSHLPGVVGEVQKVGAIVPRNE